MDTSSVETTTNTTFGGGDPGGLVSANYAGKEALEITRFIVQKILSPTVSAIGFLGNTLSIIVLSRRRMQSSTNVYLIALSVCDLLYLFFSVTLSFVHCSYRTQPKFAFYYIPYARVLADLFGNIAVWLTVSFTVERYVGVRYPMKGRVWCTVRKAKLISCLVFVVCLINTSPELFEMDIVEKQLSHSNRTIVTFVCIDTEFAKTDSYQIGYYWWFISFFTFIPMVLLSVFNSLLIRIVWKASIIRRSLANSNVTGGVLIFLSLSLSLSLSLTHSSTLPLSFSLSLSLIFPSTLSPSFFLSLSPSLSSANPLSFSLSFSPSLSPSLSLCLPLSLSLFLPPLSPSLLSLSLSLSLLSFSLPFFFSLCRLAFLKC
ncbi:unnamed protein product [Acanthosepion pharaonis]|uniref:G-protein coupled receptors family 1 profile domain-containing protein n=1 Tax=Acanthosepion pharaonis TaxID=158019 RepID=A0A812EI80_ACAPH|nr:unnamed protein product [Sepia pharaonis]